MTYNYQEFCHTSVKYIGNIITELISISVFEGFLFLAEFLLWYWNISDSIELLDNLH